MAAQSSSRSSSVDSKDQIHSHPSPPWGLRWRSSTLFIIVVVGVGIFTDLFIYSIIVPVLPFVLRDRIGIPDSQLQLYVSILLGVMAASSFVFSPVAGIIADKVGNRQQPFLAGLFALLFSTVLLAIGGTVGMIALARVLQGMSSAVVWVVGLAICLETVGPNRLGTTIGTIYSFVNLGTQAAPVIGGVLYAKTGYASVFAISVALIGVDIILRLVMIEKKTARKYQKKSLLSSPEQVDNETETAPLLGAGATTDDHLKAYELPPPSNWLTCRMPIFQAFRSPALLTAFYIGFVQAFLIGSYDSTIPLVALEYYNFNSLQSGLLFLALGIPGFVTGPIAGWFVDKYGTRTVATLGYGYLVPVHILLRLPRPGGLDQIAVFATILALASIGSSIIDSPSLVEAGLVIEKYHKANPTMFGETGPYAQLYGINSMMFSLGVTVGPLIAGELKDRIGYGNMNAVVAAVCFTAAVASWIYLGTEVRAREQRVHADLASDAT